MDQPWEAFPDMILRKWHQSIHANSPYNKAKEIRVNQSVCKEFSEYGAPMSKWHDIVYTGRDLPPQLTNHTPNSNRSNSKSHLKATSLRRWTSRRHSCKIKPRRLQKYVALNLLGNEVIRLLRLSHSTVTSEQSKSFHQYNAKDYLCSSSLWNRNPLEVYHVLLQIKKYYPWSSSTVHHWSKKYS